MPAFRSFTSPAVAAKHLDKVDPHWYKRVTRDVNQAFSHSCVAGQNYAAKHPHSTRFDNWEKQVREWCCQPTDSIWTSSAFDEYWQKEVDLRKACFRDDTTPVTPEPESERVTILAGNSVYEVDRTFDGLMRLLSHLDVHSLKEREVTKL